MSNSLRKFDTFEGLVLGDLRQHLPAKSPWPPLLHKDGVVVAWWRGVVWHPSPLNTSTQRTFPGPGVYLYLGLRKSDHLVFPSFFSCFGVYRYVALLLVRPGFYFLRYMYLKRTCNSNGGLVLRTPMPDARISDSFVLSRAGLDHPCRLFFTVRDPP